MGGKKNQAQRTKNNVKPSSSSRSADLLGKDATKFVGLISMKQYMFAGKVEPIATEDIEGIDPNFQVSLKKLSKKDAITKQKGLQELTELFRNSEEVVCKNLLPFWCQVYCNLSLDIENKVRENTQIAHHALSSRVGRNLAPYLRQVAPLWFISQFDTYPPAASSATAAFKATFPGNKVKDVVHFCHDEIFSFIYEHLISHTAQTLSKPDMSKEDTEAKYERVIICCLNGYSHYVEILSNMLSDEANQNLISPIKIMLSSNKYWSFASHKTSLIRAAWYASLVSLCKNCLQFIKEEAKHLLKSVFSNLDEPDPLVLPLVWESALYSLQIINDGSQQIDLEKLVFPKLCCILEKGGLGNAATIYPNLLPLLSNISATLTSDKNKFYQSFFLSLRTGLKQQSVKLSHSESEVIVNTFMECFRYVIMLHNDDNNFCTELIKEQLLDLMKEIESDKSHRNTVAPTYFGVADLVSYWQRSISSYPSYRAFLSLFWELLGSTFVESFTSSTHDPTLATHVFYCQHKFFETFLRPRVRNKKNLKVKFDTDEISLEPVLAEESLSELNIDSEMKNYLETLGGELLKVYYSYTEKEVSEEFKNSCICQLSLIVKLLGYDFFLECCGLQCSEFCRKLQTWLNDDNVPVEPILVLTFTALASITEEDLKKSLLEDLIQVRPEMLIVEAVKLSMTGRAEYSQITSWLKNKNVRSVLLSFIDNIHDENSGKILQVLKFCLTSSRSKEYIIGEQTVAELLKKLSGIIENADVSDIKPITSLLEDVFKEDTSSFFKNHHKSVFTLLKSLFLKSFSSTEPSLMRIVSKGISCCSMTLNVNNNEFKHFINDCGVLICNHFGRRANNNGKGDFVNVVNVSSILLDCLASCKSNENNKQELGLNLAKELLTVIINISKKNWLKPIEEISLTALAVDGDIMFEDYVQNYFTLDEGIWNPLKDIDISSYSQTVLFSLKLIYRLLGETTGEGNGDFNEGLFTNQDLNKLDLLIIDYTYALALMRTVSKYYSSTEQYFNSLEYIEPLAPCLKELVQRLDEASYPNLFEILKERVTLPKTLWTQVDEIIRVEFLESEVVEAENVNERILTSTLEESSLRALRSKLKAKKKGLENFINFICWKFDTTNKVEATAVYNTSMNNVGLLELCLSSEIARYLTELIKYNDIIIETKTWNFIMNSLAAWAQSIEKTQHPKYCKEYVGFVVSFCNLFITFSAYLEADLSADDSQSQAKEERNKYIRQNWDIFTSDVNSSIYNCWKRFAEQCTKCKMEPICLLLIESLSNAVCHIAQSGKLTFKQNYELIAMTKSCSDLLLSSCPAVQITSFLTLQSVVVHLAKLDSNLDENSADKISCLLLKDTLFKTQTVVEAMLQDFKLGVMCLVAPYTDSYIYTRANLMAWLVLLDIFKAADSRIRHLYTCWMKEERILNHLMDCLLHLLPNLGVFTSDSNTKKIQEIFSTTPSFSYSGWTSGKLSALSGFVYIHVLRILPLISRIWYSESEPKKRDFTDKFTVPYVSPLLINEEINFALNETKKCDNLSLETLPTARLVNAIFTLEDSKTELGIQLAQNHPFTPPKVDISKSVVSSSQTKQKLKQLTLFPTLQNGSLWDCIIVWKNYLDKKFEGVEECYICYSVLHYGTHQLPKLSCRTCRKRFHSACLYKWFTSSNKSTCPICRNLF